MTIIINNNNNQTVVCGGSSNHVKSQQKFSGRRLVRRSPCKELQLRMCHLRVENTSKQGVNHRWASNWMDDFGWYWGFHSHGGTPIAGCFIMEKPTKMDWGYSYFRKLPYWDCAMIIVGQLTSPNPRRIYQYVCGFTFAKIGSKIKWNPDARISQALVSWENSWGNYDKSIYKSTLVLSFKGNLVVRAFWFTQHVSDHRPGYVATKQVPKMTH